GSISLNIANIGGLQNALDLKADISQIPTNYITTNTTQTGLTGNKTTSGTWTFNSQINTANHGNSSQWNTAFGWGNHSGLYALVGRSIIAGNGLSGGGTLAANRTITLGTPSAIGLSTTNSVTSTSHTHALDASTTTV